MPSRGIYVAQLSRAIFLKIKKHQAKEMLELNWEHGQLAKQGSYFVAHEYAQGVGTFEMMEWDGKKWDCYPDTKVIAFLAWGDFKAQLNLKWLGELPEPPPRRPLSESETTYEEV